MVARPEAKSVEADARGSTPGRAEGPFSPWGIRPKAKPAREVPEGAVPGGRRRKHASSSGERGNAGAAATAPATARPMRSGTADAAVPGARSGTASPPSGMAGNAGQTGRTLFRKEGGSEGQGTAEGRGELRRWKARVPAAATVGAGSNAGPHLVLGHCCREHWRQSWKSLCGAKLTRLTQSRAQSVPDPAPHPPPSIGAPKDGIALDSPALEHHAARPSL